MSPPAGEGADSSSRCGSETPGMAKPLLAAMSGQNIALKGRAPLGVPSFWASINPTKVTKYGYEHSIRYARLCEKA